MRKVLQFLEEGGQLILFPLCLGLAVFFFIKGCNSEKRREMAYSENKAHYDSLRRAKEEEQNRIKKEIENNRIQFYYNFRKYYSFFESPEEFINWLDDFSDPGAMEFLHYMYCIHFDKFKGDNGFEEMLSYLGWKEPEYWVNCDVCDNEFKFSPPTLFYLH